MYQIISNNNDTSHNSIKYTQNPIVALRFNFNQTKKKMNNQIQCVFIYSMHIHEPEHT